MTERYFLKKDDRLKSRKAIELLFLKGKSFSNFPFRVIWLEVENQIGLKAGFTASTKKFKNASDRNKIKRLMRESYRLQKNEVSTLLKKRSSSLSIFFIYTGKEVPDYDLVFEKMGAALKRIVKLVDEKIE